MSLKRKKEDEDSHLLQAILTKRPVNDILALINIDEEAVRHKGMNGDYPLHAACKINDDDDDDEDEDDDAAQDDYENDTVILKLIQIFPQGAAEKTMDGEYSIHLALESSKSEDVIIKLIEAYPEAVLFKNSNGIYALHMACERMESEEVIRKLIDIHPLALREVDHSGDYPIHYAIWKKQSIEIIQLLVYKDTFILQQQDSDGRTPLHFACYKNQVGTVEFLLKFSNVLINSQDTDGNTPLSYACKEGFYTIVDMLLLHSDIDVNAINNDGDSALHISTDPVGHMISQDRRVPINCFPILVRSLLQHPYILIHGKNNSNRTPLDLVNNTIDDIKGLDDNQQDRESSLPFYMDIKMILEDFHVKRKWNASEYFMENVEDWSVSEK